MAINCSVSTLFAVHNDECKYLQGDFRNDHWGGFHVHGCRQMPPSALLGICIENFFSPAHLLPVIYLMGSCMLMLVPNKCRLFRCSIQFMVDRIHHNYALQVCMEEVFLYFLFCSFPSQWNSLWQIFFVLREDDYEISRCVAAFAVKVYRWTWTT